MRCRSLSVPPKDASKKKHHFLIPGNGATPSSRNNGEAAGGAHIAAKVTLMTTTAIAHRCRSSDPPMYHKVKEYESAICGGRQRDDATPRPVRHGDFPRDFASDLRILHWRVEMELRGPVNPSFLDYDTK
ncbi:hypothetical protein BHE74_00021226 [Ensete ventricosum]|uniref:Uncharacterized protein n=1 Tax=Ensete ventricosum TaxID=4639 RepID=A0A444EEA4_ENSVE|nr:hypothetical protein B296_00031983 [Ensete ventricosum]RWW08703.1 hypothetical protein GW17_00027837 [Ensete ventricosum]RWW71063.1 hypothetical protein BHE74_00021226 [Ensete ventricosum]